ncbi:MULTISPECIES: phosphonate ABC transporter ATP-binding protein [Lactiplantibacillus]|jgi:phosphonate transport system ATP-binding protein|uniref:ABC superfamily ATP binding cassette transporter, ABC protein n=1 Tax=Lactiplantibacillus xiangfangensis TaxID=942150 RepID=A0A0R2M4W3_9LACO|nr:phosphonate ABC transporter ATP-binding protein [Lactiplantibacillus xiangfangensis]KRO09135.1 ABC superfamily ATP binding cassette transporter, ABC protein [Lactiplantibacillus xiangfangensis]
MLKVIQLDKTYGSNKRSLKDVNFTAQPGEVTAIIGPSGAGKTTILRSVNQLIRDDSGQILLDDQDIRQANKAELRKIRHHIGMIFQNYNLISPLTALENVLHGRLGAKSTVAGMLGLYSNEEKTEALALLDEVGLKEYAYQRCDQLSGGQQQRVGIARALMQHPKMILCDEPIASLDPKSTKIVMDILRKLAKEKQLIILINLHQVDIAMEYADHIIGINSGAIVFEGATKAVDDDVLQKIYRQADDAKAVVSANED